MNPMVTVIIIFLNAEAFLEEAIESVLAQTYDPWELLLVDDGSTDGSTEIARKYARLYPENMRYLDHENHANRGKSTSRNMGIRHAKGQYIAFLDADDLFLPQKLERQTAILDARPDAAMVYGPSLYWHGWTGKQEDIRRDFKGRLGVPPHTLIQPPALLTRFLRNGEIVPCLCSLLVRRRILEDCGGFDETIQHLYEDQVLLAKICTRASVFVDSGCWDKYRQHPGSSSNVAIKKGEYHPLKPNPSRLSYLAWLVGHVDTEKLYDRELITALRKALRPYRYPALFRILAPFQYLADKIRWSWRRVFMQGL
jgi:glycosyltransferase involved in cell wall biosynthesis